MNNSSTYIGSVQDVQGATIGVFIDKDTISGLTFIEGQSYRIGQVGSFVKISIGFLQLYGIVSQVGASAAPKATENELPDGQRWLSVQLVGEGYLGKNFQRGLSQYPTIGDEVHIVTESDLRIIYGSGEVEDHVSVGWLASSESIPAYVNINKLVTRHSAILGTTGSGKSTTVAGIVTALSNIDRYPSSRILVLDIHGEYQKSFRDFSTTFKTDPNQGENTQRLQVPYWALNFDELCKVCFDSKLEGNKASKVSDMVFDLKRNTLHQHPYEGLEEDSLTVDSPVPFSIHQLWFDLHVSEHKTIHPNENRDTAYTVDENGSPIQEGEPLRVIPPIYKNIKRTGGPNERVEHSNEGVGLRSQVATLGSRLKDPRYAFLFNPGDFLPDLDGTSSLDIDSLIESWIGQTTPVTILDLSGIPLTILDSLIGALLRILYDAIFWARKLPEGGQERPLLLVLEEAHTYLNSQENSFASSVVKRIAKEGRKYGVGLMIISQRPSEIDTTVLSQCGTIFALRLSSENDRSKVIGASSDNLKGLFDMLPILRTGESIIVGESVSLPIRTLIQAPPEDRRPDSMDPTVVSHGSPEEGFDSPGGWNQQKGPSDYQAVARQWRSQSPNYVHQSNTEE